MQQGSEIGFQAASIYCKLGASSRKEAVEEPRTTGSSSLPTKPPISPRGKEPVGDEEASAVHYARGESNGKQSEDAFGTADAAWKDG